MRRIWGRILLAAAVLGGLALPAAAQDTMAEVKQRGQLIVGVKADYKPYGFRSPDGQIVGLEPDLAADVAERLGVELELVPVVASNRMEFLQQGKIDLMIATMTDTPERRQVVWIVEPDYYSSGVNVLAPEAVGLKEWSDLKGKPVCGIQGAFYNRRTSEEFGAELVAFTGTAEALTALQQGRCVAFVYDDSFIVSKLQEPEWASYVMPLPSIDDSPWGLAVRLGDQKFHDFMVDVVEDWHKSGLIIGLAQKWEIEPTGFVQEMHDKYKAM